MREPANGARCWAEKISTRLVAGNDLIVFEKLPLAGMVRRPAPRPCPDRPGGYLPNRARAKAGLNRGILASAWGVLGTRTRQKAGASGVTVVFAGPRFTSQQCHACGAYRAGEPRESSGLPVRRVRAR